MFDVELRRNALTGINRILTLRRGIRSVTRPPSRNALTGINRILTEEEALSSEIVDWS